MARCGCVAQCACAVQADPDCPNVTVTGNGSAGAPFRICVAPTPVAVEDTTTIDMSISGDGTALAPWTISGEVILVPDATGPLGTGTNLVKEDPTGLYVACEDVQDCIGQAIQAGTGVEYDDAGNAISVIPSTDPLNLVVTGTDGRLFVPPAAAGAAVTDGVCIIGTGTAIDPIRPQIDPAVACPEAINLLACGPQGLVAELAVSQDPCNAIEGNGTCAAPLFLGPLDNLSVDPLFSRRTFATSGPQTGVNPYNGNIFQPFGVPLAAVGLVNPSQCRSMFVFAFYTIIGRPSTQDNDGFSLGFTILAGGSVLGAIFAGQGPDRNQGMTALGIRQGLTSFYTVSRNASVPPGGTFNTTIQPLATGLNVDNGIITDVFMEITLIGILR